MKHYAAYFLTKMYKKMFNDIWKLSRKSELTPETTEAGIVFFAIIHIPQKLSELTHSSLETFIYHILMYLIQEYHTIEHENIFKNLLFIFLQFARLRIPFGQSDTSYRS